MAPDRLAALTAGVLFIVATAASLLSYAVEHPVLTGTDYLTRIAENTGRVSAGGLLELVAAGASAGIAISLYPVLRKRSQGPGTAGETVPARLLDTPALQRLFRQSPGGARPARAAAGDHAVNVRLPDT